MSELKLVTGRPLCVDLDDSFLKTDILFEAILYCLRYRPLLFLWFVVLLFRSGRAKAKDFLARESGFRLDTLPVNEAVLEVIRTESATRPLVLVTASPQIWADAIRDRFPIFTEVFGSSQLRNLKGFAKRDFLVEQYGAKNFDYLGDSHADLQVWAACFNSYYVGSNKKLEREVRSVSELVKTISSGKKPLAVIVKAIRVHQWIKNILVFVPLIAAHQIHSGWGWLAASISFLAFSFTASSVYLLNDLSDLDSDRLHRSKRFRPLASGDLKIRDALIILPLLLVAALGLALFLPPSFMVVMAVYFLTTTMYSFYFKRKAMLDIMVLSSLYTLRIIAGASATGMIVSLWLFSFSMFFFFSLACAKRFAELVGSDSGNDKVPGRGYQYRDRELVGILGVSSAMTSILVLALYVTAQDVVQLYTRPYLLLTTCPLLLLWLSRIWLAAYREELDDDPIVYALKYRGSYILGAIFILILVGST